MGIGTDFSARKSGGDARSIAHNAILSRVYPQRAVSKRTYAIFATADAGKGPFATAFAASSS